ncbi:hypothetical protein GCK32_006123 [Trichostrongylus colubriformis]|uniref:DUF7774 domain-containing protein n=1 Tax=Trichostrongylus colubriformis TaxID=6319 RepID=A0AAN8G001_TRICO
MSAPAKKSKGTTSKSHQRGRRQFRKIFRSWKKRLRERKRSDDIQSATVFEVCDAPRRPAVATQTEYKLKWKNGKLGSHPSDDIDFDEVQKTKDFQIAKQIMAQLRSNNILETMVSDDNLSIVRKFFKENLDHPTPEVIEIIDTAMEKCYNEVMFRQQRYDLFMDADMRDFLLNKEKAKHCLLDVILICPEFVPLRWGGESVGLPSDEEISKVPPTLSKEQHISPWQKAVKKASAERGVKEVSNDYENLGSLELIKSWDKKKSSSDSSSRSETEKRISGSDKSDDERRWAMHKKRIARSVERATRRNYAEKGKEELPKKGSGLVLRIKETMIGKKSKDALKSESEEKSGEDIRGLPRTSRSVDRRSAETAKKAWLREMQTRIRGDNLKTGRETTQRSIDSAEKIQKARQKERQARSKEENLKTCKETEPARRLKSMDKTTRKSKQDLARK